MPRRKGSFIWQYFEKDEHDKQFARCLECRKEYKSCGNTTNLRDHLKRAHNITENYSFKILTDEGILIQERDPIDTIDIENSETAVEGLEDVIMNSGVQDHTSPVPPFISKMEARSEECTRNTKSSRKRKMKEQYPVKIEKAPLEMEDNAQHQQQQPKPKEADYIDVFLQYVGNKIRRIKSRTIRNKLEDLIIDVVREACNDDDDD